MFRLETSKIKELNEILKLVNIVNPYEAYIFTDSGRVCFAAIDPSHVILSYFYLNNANNHYKLENKLKKKILIPNFKTISDILKICKGDSFLSMEYNRDKLTITIFQEDNNTILLKSCFGVESDSELYEFPKIGNMIQFNLDIPNFKKILNLQSILCEDFKLKTENNNLVLVGERKKLSNLEETKSPLHFVTSLKNPIDANKKLNVNVFLNFDFMEVVKKTLDISETCSISLNKNLPVIFEFVLKNNQGHVKYFISPKVSK